MKFKNIIFLLFVVLFLVIGIFLLLNNSLEKKIAKIYESGCENVKIMPDNVNEIPTFTSKLSYENIYNSMYFFLTDSVKYYYNKTQKLSASEIYSYFDKNAKRIEKELRIENKEDFLDFAENLKKLNNNKLKLVSYTINPKTVKQNVFGVEFILIVKYENNEKIGFNVTICKDVDNKKSPIMYKTCYDDSDLDYEFKFEENENEFKDFPGKSLKYKEE